MTTSTVPAEPEADLAESGLRLGPVRDAVAELVGLGASAWSAMLDDITEPAARRHGAGLLLGLVGDPRLSVFDPSMVDIPAATVAMGLAPERLEEVAARWRVLGVQVEWIAKEVPRHEVRVEAFRIGRYPVTNEEFLAFVLDTRWPHRPSAWSHGTYPLASSNHPVYSVSPETADAYAAWLAERTGRRFRLPTEAEWEYAASGGDGREYPWGDEWDPELANTAEAGPLTSTPVGIHPGGRSPFGVYDMAGNVEEYVADDYRPYPGASVIADDLIDTHGDHYRVARGGSYARHGDLCRCARRHGWYPSDHFAMGFRLAETPI